MAMPWVAAVSWPWLVISVLPAKMLFWSAGSWFGHHPPGFGGTQRLPPRLIGSMSVAKELLYTGRNVRSDEALRIGLVSAVHPQESLLDEAWKIANRISANAPIAVENAKTSVNATMELGLEEGIELETDLFSECFDSEDQKEGMAAFLEKRKEKNFKNR